MKLRQVNNYERQPPFLLTTRPGPNYKLRHPNWKLNSEKGKLVHGTREMSSGVIEVMDSASDSGGDGDSEDGYDMQDVVDEFDLEGNASSESSEVRRQEITQVISSQSDTNINQSEDRLLFHRLLKKVT